jgi:hypothetical protein
VCGGAEKRKRGSNEREGEEEGRSNVATNVGKYVSFTALISNYPCDLIYCWGTGILMA